MYRRCAEELGTIPGMELTMLTVREWRMNARPMPFEPLSPDAMYGTVIGNVGWKGFENRGFYTSGLRRAFQRSRPDVLFLMEEPFSIFASQVLLAKSLFAPRIPVVFFTWNNLSLTTFDYRPSIFYRTVARHTLPRMDYALTANAAGVEVLRQAGFTKPVRIIGYGVDTEIFRTGEQDRSLEIRRRFGIEPEDAVIGYIGRLLEMKGVDLLIEALACLNSEQAFKRIKLLLVGSGEAEQSLLELAQKRGIGSIVRHVPSVAPGEVADYMRALDILVLPSRRQGMWAEQFGRVLVEAMAAGKIVIGSFSGAIPEVVRNAGFIFPENDVKGLTSVIKQALTLRSPARSELLGRARERAEYFSWRRFANDAFEAISFLYENARLRSERKRSE